MTVQFWNQAWSALSGNITASQTTLALDGSANDGGDAFWDSVGADATTKPSTTYPAYWTVRQYNTLSGNEATDRASGILKEEIIMVEGISGDNVTITARGILQSTGQAFDTGSYVYNFITKETMGAIRELASLAGSNSNFEF